MKLLKGDESLIVEAIFSAIHCEEQTIEDIIFSCGKSTDYKKQKVIEHEKEKEKYEKVLLELKKCSQIMS